MRGRLDGRVAEQGERLDRVEAKVSASGEAVIELRDEVGALRGEVTAQGGRLDALTGEVETLGPETRRELRELPAQLFYSWRR